VNKHLYLCHPLDLSSPTRNRVSTPSKKQTLQSYTKRPGKLWCPSNLVISGYRVPFTDDKPARPQAKHNIPFVQWKAARWTISQMYLMKYSTCFG